MEKVNYKMITLARESRGLSQGELSDISRIAHWAISRFEFGMIQPSEEELQCIAQALNYPTSFFYQEYQPVNSNLW